MKLSRPNYFQGILQLRDVNNEIMDFVKKQIAKRNDVAITRTVKYPNGTDFYITSQQFIRSVARKLKESFGGELKVTSELHTRSREGKELYRVNALFRLSKHKAGDVVNVRGDDVRLLTIGKNVFAREMKTGRKIRLRREDLP
ncbi:hypothetical protein HYS31_07630 [Candidatus Woesearchaeota archaeon]|nr:hypothetical protein [Candidatus Woesearchaeota archaeon]